MSCRETTFLLSCYSGNINKVQTLLLEGVEPNFVCKNLSDFEGKFQSYSALCLAALEGHLEVTKLLLEWKADVNYRCKHGESALFLAASKGHVKICECLLKYGAKVAYTAKSGDNVFLENWEVFTQALKYAYPKDIDDPANTNYKAVAQLLLESNASGQRPCTLYEVLYCSLTVFVNPIAVYCVGVYSQLSPEQQASVFCEETFLSALSNAFEFSQYLEFINTVSSILNSSKLRQKEVSQTLVKHFNWADLICKIAEKLNQLSAHKSIIDFMNVKKVFSVFNQIITNFSVRSDMHGQFLALAIDDVGKIGRLVQYVVQPMEKGDGLFIEYVEMWHFLFFLLKQFLREGQKAHVARLLLRSYSQKESSSPHSNCSYSELERMVLLRSVEDDIALSHMLLDYGVTVNGNCFVNFALQGHVDLVDRCASDKELLFSKEVSDLLQMPVSVRNASNRNMRRCIKVIKNQRNAIEKVQSEMEKEQLMGDSNVTKFSKKKQRQRIKRSDSSKEKQNIIGPKTEKPLENSIAFGGKSEVHSNGAQIFETKSLSKQLSHDSDGDNLFGEHNKENTGKKNSRKRKKNRKKTNGIDNIVVTKNEEASSEEKIEDSSPEICDDSGVDPWKEVMQAASRRRRQSSSSSDCSTGPKKSVHFSHPIAFYENIKATAKLRLRRIPSNIEPKGSNLKRTATVPDSFNLAETYRTNKNAYVEPFTDFSSYIPWRSVSKRWCARFEDLSETDLARLKQLALYRSDCDDWLYFCDQQRHLLIGSGPDFTSIFLGITSKGKEVSVKKINTKRAHRLYDQNQVNNLLNLSDHDAINRYRAIILDKSHFYILQDVGEYSLEQIIKKKLCPLPMTAQDAFRQLASGLDFLHRHNVLHMALKPSNVLLDVANKLRLSDYGIHLRGDQDGKRNSPTPTLSCFCWTATDSPTFKGKLIFSKESDIKALGIVFYYILTEGGHPYGNPDNYPGECMQNIVKDNFNLKSLSEPLSCDLIKSMIAKGNLNHPSLNQVLLHPYFWSEQEKDIYFDLLVQSTSLDGELKDIKDIIEFFEAHYKDVSEVYPRKELFKDIPRSTFTSINSLLRFIRDCMSDSTMIDRYFEKSTVASSASSIQFLRMCFPCFLLHGHRAISKDKLEQIQYKYNLHPNGDSDISINPDRHESMVDVDATPLCKSMNVNLYLNKSSADNRTENICGDTHSNFAPLHLLSDIKVSRKEPAFDITEPSAPVMKKEDPKLNNLDDTFYFKNRTMKENDNLCLIPGTNFDSEGLLDEDLSSATLNSNILLSCDWDSYTNQVDDFEKEENLTSKEFSDEKVSQTTSPDDWIEVGSPLVETVGKPLNSFVPINHSKISSDSHIDDNSSSGCSVDECYDFDKYIANNCENSDFTVKTDHAFSVLVNKQGVCGFQYEYTDLDELD